MSGTEKIYRYELGITDYQEISLPGEFWDTEFLSVAVSRTNPNNRIDLWSLVREGDGSPGHRVGVHVIGTGNPIPKELTDAFERQFVGTVVTPIGLVWHVFVRSPEDSRGE